MNTAHTSPMPRPGILPPTLKGKGDGVKVEPWSVDMRICPLLGSQLLVYIPVACSNVRKGSVQHTQKLLTKYKRSGSTGSVASASTPQ